MSNVAWPHVKIPGGTVEKHLEAIRKEAHGGAGAKAGDIGRAVDACLRSECFLPGTVQRGKAPADGAKHGMCVLIAHTHSAEGRWGDCLDALLHGEPPDSSRKQQK